MIKFFRKIRQNLLSEGKTGKYLKYAIGEIILVIVGVLIALWLNNQNQQRIESQESSTLKLTLKEELVENKKTFKRYVEQCHEKIITILNVSAGENTEIPIDTLRKLAIEMLPTIAININKSRLNSAKASGQFKLLSSEEVTVLADYETTLDGFKNARELNTVFNKENRELFIYFSLVQEIYRQFNPHIVFEKHPDYNLSDKDFLSFLKKGETNYESRFV